MPFVNDNGFDLNNGADVKEKDTEYTEKDTLIHKPNFNKGGQTGGQTLSEMQKRIIIMMIETPRITREKISKNLNINVSAVQKHIKKLKESDIIRRQGGDFGGYWEIIAELKAKGFIEHTDLDKVG